MFSNRRPPASTCARSSSSSTKWSRAPSSVSRLLSSNRRPCRSSSSGSGCLPRQSSREVPRLHCTAVKQRDHVESVRGQSGHLVAVGADGGTRKKHRSSFEITRPLRAARPRATRSRARGGRYSSDGAGGDNRPSCVRNATLSQLTQVSATFPSTRRWMMMLTSLKSLPVAGRSPIGPVWTPVMVET